MAILGAVALTMLVAGLGGAIGAVRARRCLARVQPPQLGIRDGR